MVILMKLKPKNNIEFIEKGGCFLYYFEKDPRCFLTNILIESKINIFSNDQEKDELYTHNCNGEIKKCPYIHNLWDLNNKSENINKNNDGNDEKDEKIDKQETPLLNIGPLTIDFDYSWPTENNLYTDALVIPTDTKLLFENFINFGEDNNRIISNECKKRQFSFDIGDVLLTHGANTGYPKIIHGIILKHGGLSMDINQIGLSLYNSFIKADEEGYKSIAIHPFVKIDHDILTPSVNLYLKICLIAISTFVEEYDVKNTEYILIHIPPNFISNLQDVIDSI